jgi:rfaE bifunctional protein nucleotidyltransferase chain/domain
VSVGRGGAADAAPVLNDAQRGTLEAWRAAGQRVVFTNGVFDLLHRGHVEYLSEARSLGDRLVVGINSDDSARGLGKGEDRPLVGEDDRAAVVAALACVDMVVRFDEDTPERLIREVRPAVLAKGGDWPAERIVGREFVESNGGRVVRIPLREGFSTTGLLERIRGARKPGVNVRQAVPFFRVSDIQESLRFYVEGLGFRMTIHWIDEGRLRWCWLELGDAALMLQEFRKEGLNAWVPDGKVGIGVSICFTCEDALAIYHAAAERGLHPAKPFVGNRMWVTSLSDPDGYRLEFESRTDMAEGTEYSGSRG